MHHIFCIHSSVKGQLGSFQLLTVINKAAMNIVAHVTLLPLGTSSDYTPKSVNYCWIFWYYYVEFSEEPPDWLPEWLYQNAIPPAKEDCSFSTSLPASAVTWVFDLSPTGVRWNLRVVLICISLMTYRCWTFLQVLLSHSLLLSWEFFVKLCTPFFK